MTRRDVSQHRPHPGAVGSRCVVGAVADAVVGDAAGTVALTGGDAAPLDILPACRCIECTLDPGVFTNNCILHLPLLMMTILQVCQQFPTRSSLLFSLFGPRPLVLPLRLENASTSARTIAMINKLFRQPTPRCSQVEMC